MDMLLKNLFILTLKLLLFYNSTFYLVTKSRENELKNGVVSGRGVSSSGLINNVSM